MESLASFQNTHNRRYERQGSSGATANTSARRVARLAPTSLNTLYPSTATPELRLDAQVRGRGDLNARAASRPRGIFSCQLSKFLLVESKYSLARLGIGASFETAALGEAFQTIGRSLLSLLAGIAIIGLVLLLGIALII